MIQQDKLDNTTFNNITFIIRQSIIRYTPFDNTITSMFQYFRTTYLKMVKILLYVVTTLIKVALHQERKAIHNK